MSAVLESAKFDTMSVDGDENRYQRLLSGERYELVPAARPFEGLRRASRRWKSSLCEQDMTCLLHILETDLIPQMLSGYSPARHAPLSPDSTG